MATQPSSPQYLSPGDDEEVLAMSTSLSKIEEADRSHQIATARQYPRSITEFTKQLTEIACLSQPTAMAMIYSLPRAGKQIVGPSIRFAEAVAACWGNIRVGVEVVDVDRKERVVVSEGRYYDCEKNVGIALRKRRRIVAKEVNADSIQITGDAGSSIALRDAILRGVPKAIWEPIFEQAKKTAAGDAKSMEQIRTILLQHFRTLAITDVQIFNALEVTGPADLGPDQILALQAWKKQLNDGDCTIEEIFGSPLDEQIQALMDSLDWNGTKQRMSREAYKGRRQEHLDYLKGLSGNAAPGKATVVPIHASESTKAQPQAKQAADEKPEPTQSAPADLPAGVKPDPAETTPPAQSKGTRQGAIAW
ncbi:MAG: hypothetical protein ACLQLH_02575 [Terracidiphilus sp.]